MKAAPASHAIDLTFRAFADPTRLRILSLLRDWEELCVCDLVGVLELPQAKVSRHLAYLRRAGLVNARRAGQWMHYRLCPAEGAFHAKLLECLNCCFNEVTELRRDRRRLARRKPAGEAACCG